MAFITIFTAPKPFSNPHIAAIQYNALLSWKKLAPDVEVLMIGEEEGMAEVATRLEIRHLPTVRRNQYGTPLISSMLDLARANSQSALLAIINTDIILMPDLLFAAKKISERYKKFMMLGQRWDLSIDKQLDFSNGWQEQLHERLRTDGKYHPPGGSDYFIFPRACYQKVPDFAIGRAGWDNWMIYEARQRGWNVVDATKDVSIIHQNHDYSHLPNNQPHYRLPETYENVRLAGGHRTVFGIIDANKILENGKVKPIPLNWKKFWREVEIFPLVHLHSFLIGQVSYAVFHPLRAFRDLRKWMSAKTKVRPISDKKKN